MRSSFVASTLALSSVLGVGCSSASPGSDAGTVTGAVHAAGLARPLSAVAREGTFFSGDKDTARGLRILVSDKSNTCTSTHFAGSTNIDVRIRGDNVGPGTYPIVDAAVATPASKQAEVDFDAVDGTCKDLVAEAAVRGSITIKTVEINLTDPSESRVTGSIDATFANGHVAGDFEAVFCESPAPTPAADPKQVACVP